MSGESTGQVLGAATTTGGIALLPATGESTLINILVMGMIIAGLTVLLSFTGTRIYRSITK